MNLKLGSNRRTTVSRLQRQLRNFIEEQRKMQEQHRAQREVELYEAYIDMLRTIHLDVDEFTDWEKIAATPPPFDIGDRGPYEQQAEHAYTHYKPSLWDRLFRRTDEKKEQLKQQIAIAKVEDKAAYEAWQQEQELAHAILRRDIAVYGQAVDLRQPFADLTELGSDFEFYIDGGSLEASVDLRVHSRKIIPTQVKTLTKTGRLSLSKMPVTQFHSLEQDYVCSTIYRVARDLFALLPISEVIVNATDFQMNEAIGKVELVTIVSVRIERAVLESLNLTAIDPSEALTNFEHRMSFLKTKGFQPVERLEERLNGRRSYG